MPFSTIRSPSHFIMLADVYDGFQWEKYYENEPWPANSMKANRSGIVAYRHGDSTVVAFGDGHAEVYRNEHPDAQPLGFETGLQEAYLAGKVTHKLDGR